MALFSSIGDGGISAVKAFLKKITDTVLTWINTALEFTGKLIALEANPTVELIAGIIAQFTGLPVLQYAATALSDIKGVEVTIQTLATELSTWLANETVLGVQAKLIKLASGIAKAGSMANGAAAQPQSFWDTATQIHAVQPIAAAPQDEHIDELS